jgi:hypothetical protein
MKAKLIKTELEDYHMGHYFLNDTNYYAIGSTDFGWCKTSAGIPKYKLSKENCDEIFGVVDVGALALEECNNTDPLRLDSVKYKQDPYFRIGYLKGYNKAMELMGNNKFNDNNIVDAFMAGHLRGMSTDMGEDNTHPICSEYLNSLQQPTEIEVEIKLICPHPSDTYVCGMEYGCDADGCNHPEQIPYLDKTGCLILKRL